MQVNNLHLGWELIPDLEDTVQSFQGKEDPWKKKY